ncbi:MAG: GNAT family N-acetyltransferase [Sphingobacteriales bacterium]
MKHVLDNPAWSALQTGNKHLAFGNDQAAYFDREVSPFAALEENSEDNFLSLHQMLPHNVILFVTPVKIDFSPQWEILQYIHGLQMVCDASIIKGEISTSLIPLSEDHVPQMLELTKLTNPGPFASRTIDFGHYQGIFEGDKLVAMAGQRLHPANYAEISAVCTHPDHLGKGYARQLVLNQIQRIKAANETPFLHVRSNNDRAVKVYESLGFSTRIDVHFYVLKKV